MIAAAGALGAGCSAAPEAGDDTVDAFDSDVRVYDAFGTQGLTGNRRERPEARAGERGILRVV
jgi:hypothetical protein